MPCLLQQYSWAHTLADDAIEPQVFHKDLAAVPSIVHKRFRNNLKYARNNSFPPGTQIPRERISNACDIARRALKHCPACHIDLVHKFTDHAQKAKNVLDDAERDADVPRVHVLLPDVYDQSPCSVPMQPDFGPFVTRNHVVLPSDTHGQVYLFDRDDVHPDDLEYLLHEVPRRPALQANDAVFLRLLVDDDGDGDEDLGMSEKDLRDIEAMLDEDEDNAQESICSA